MAETPDPAHGSLTWSPLTPADLPAIEALHRTVIAAVAAEGLVKPEDPSFFIRMVGADGETTGVFAGPDLVAYGILQWRLPAQDDPRAVFGLAPDAPLAKLAGTSVRPDWWGHRLHGALVDRRLARAAAAGFGHAYATSAPANQRSWRTLIDHGFAIRAIAERYHGLVRFLFHRPLGTASTAKTAPCAETECPADDLATLDRHFAAGARAIGWRRDREGRILLRLTEGASCSAGAPHP